LKPYTLTRTEVFQFYACPHCQAPTGADRTCPCLLAEALQQLPRWVLRGVVRILAWGRRP
jgi:hypothetical protein